LIPGILERDLLRCFPGGTSRLQCRYTHTHTHSLSI